MLFCFQAEQAVKFYYNYFIGIDLRDDNRPLSMAVQ